MALSTVQPRRHKRIGTMLSTQHCSVAQRVVDDDESRRRLGSVGSGPAVSLVGGGGGEAAGAGGAVVVATFGCVKRGEGEEKEEGGMVGAGVGAGVVGGDVKGEEVSPCRPRGFIAGTAMRTLDVPGAKRYKRPRQMATKPSPAEARMTYAASDELELLGAALCSPIPWSATAKKLAFLLLGTEEAGRAERVYHAERRGRTEPTVAALQRCGDVTSDRGVTATERSVAYRPCSVSF